MRIFSEYIFPRAPVISMFWKTMQQQFPIKNSEMIKVLNVGDVCILTLWKLEFTMDIFETPIYNGLLRQTLH